MKLHKLLFLKTVKFLYAWFVLTGCYIVYCPEEEDTQKTQPKFSKDLYKVFYGGGQYVAVETGLVMHSEDGITWTEAKYHPYIAYGEYVVARTSIFDAVYGNGTWLLHGMFVENRCFGLAYSTDDCKTWHAVDELRTSGLTTKIAYGAGKFIFVSPMEAGYSEDGVSWNIIQDSPFYSIENTGLIDIVYSDEKFIAIKGNSIASSEDGIAWTLIETDSMVNNFLYALSYGGGVWVADGKATVYSTDGGATWTQSPNLYGGSSIDYGNGRFIVIKGTQDYASIAYSTDGITWEKNAELYPYLWTKNPFAEINSIAFGGGKFLAVGNSGLIIQSVDGIHWEIIDVVLLDEQ